jgi:hypothetical protein
MRLRIALGLAVVWLLIGSVGAGGTGAANSCASDSSQIVLARGTSPMGGPWNVSAQRRRNRGCHEALLEINVHYQGVGQRPFLWGGASALSPSGRLGQGFRITGTDNPRASRHEGELAGYVCGRAQTAVARFSDGSMRTFSPRLPDRTLREQHVWLQNLRFFVIFHAPGIHVKSITLVDGGGNAFGHARNFGGELF